MVRAPELVTIEERRLRRLIPAAALAMLALSALCLALAPLLMPDSYSIVEHSISESAAQRVEGVWLARTGLMVFGLAVLSLASAARGWELWARVAHRAYGVAIISSAVFAHMPWEDVPYDEFEDTLHTGASFAVGLSFVVGVILVSMTRRRPSVWVRSFDGLAVVASVVIPMVMFNLTGYAGVVQRMMFAIAYLWYGMEAWKAIRPTGQHIEWDSSVAE